MKKLEETIEQIEQLLSKLFSYRLFWILSIILAIIILFLVCYFWVFAPDFLNLTEKQQQARELHSGLIRNRAWILWMLASFTGLTIGLWLTNRGRRTQEKQWRTQEKQSDIQHKAHLHERLEKATAMLENEAISTRITACRLLMSLAIDDGSMKVLCVRLLFSFINNPYLKPNEKDKDLNHLFPEDEPLRPDIQEATNSFSAIYHRYGFRGIDNEPINLPVYFWKNKHKGLISFMEENLSYINMLGAYLRGANLQGVFAIGANLQGADLSDANLQGANLSQADMQGADLSQTDMQGADLSQTDMEGVNLALADITGAKMGLAKNLIKDQIIFAKWGIKDGIESNPPSLPKELMDDLEIQIWLGLPDYTNKESNMTKGWLKVIKFFTEGWQKNS